MGIINYIKETQSEMKHVAWPTKQQTFVYTGLVIIVSVVIAAYLGFFDAIFAKGLAWIIG